MLSMFLQKKCLLSPIELSVAPGFVEPGQEIPLIIYQPLAFISIQAQQGEMVCFLLIGRHFNLIFHSFAKEFTITLPYFCLCTQQIKLLASLSFTENGVGINVLSLLVITVI